uniref:Spore protein YkvP/CgeB glycosyl transferase-like domain-containing protein n=1 Tax=Phaeomonas parva TaxID=124430 RepID=A0A7S1U936_9STRA|mmetsp:Transcript_35930/g.112814  ORF Transcript_35930/g.112814 Transcript_35930/m.112814 type:complete len:1421 (+) Transcript_35930:386-4648(+)
MMYGSGYGGVRSRRRSGKTSMLPCIGVVIAVIYGAIMIWLASNTSLSGDSGNRDDCSTYQSKGLDKGGLIPYGDDLGSELVLLAEGSRDFGSRPMLPSVRGSDSHVAVSATPMGPERIPQWTFRFNNVLAKSKGKSLAMVTLTISGTKSLAKKTALRTLLCKTPESTREKAGERCATATVPPRAKEGTILCFSVPFSFMASNGDLALDVFVTGDHEQPDPNDKASVSFYRRHSYEELDSRAALVKGPKLAFDQHNCQLMSAKSQELGVTIPSADESEGWNLVSSAKYHKRRSRCQQISVTNEEIVSSCLNKCRWHKDCNTVNFAKQSCEIMQCKQCNIYNCEWTEKGGEADVYTRLPNRMGSTSIDVPVLPDADAPRTASSYGYATLICNDDSVFPAIAMVESLRDSGNMLPVHFITAAKVDPELVEWLQTIGNVYQVPLVQNPNSANDKALPKDKLTYRKHHYELYLSLYPSGNQQCLYTKLFAWMLPLDKVLFLDADTMIMTNIDNLFDIPLGTYDTNMIAAVPDVAPPDEFNTGVFLTEPSPKRFTELMTLAGNVPSWNGGDQGFLQTVFQGWYSASNVYRLPYEYNTQTKMKVLYNAAWIHLYDRIKILHFSPHKPWHDPNSEDKEFGVYNKRWWKLLENGGSKSGVGKLRAEKFRLDMIQLANSKAGLTTALDAQAFVKSMQTHAEEFAWFSRTLEKRDAIRSTRVGVNKKPCIKEGLTCTSHVSGPCTPDSVPGGRALNVVLHSQTLCRDDGYTSGSEVTTFGMEQALLHRPDIQSVLRVGPGRYNKLWQMKHVDMMIIEGYHMGLEKEVFEVKKRWPKVFIIFVNLSVSGFAWSVHLPVDAVFTNSGVMKTILMDVMPARIVHQPLAAMPASDPCVQREEYQVNVAHVGEYSKSKTDVYNMILNEAKDFGLVLWGRGWNSSPWKDYWRGILPAGDLEAVYCNAKVVLGMTRDSQASLNMVNNRVLDVLSVGGVLISDYFYGVEEMLGNETVLFAKGPGDTSRHLTRVLNDEGYRDSLRLLGQQVVVKAHRWNTRVQNFLTAAQAKNPELHVMSMHYPISWRYEEAKPWFNDKILAWDESLTAKGTVVTNPSGLHLGGSQGDYFVSGRSVDIVYDSKVKKTHWTSRLVVGTVYAFELGSGSRRARVRQHTIVPVELPGTPCLDAGDVAEGIEDVRLFQRSSSVYILGFYTLPSDEGSKGVCNGVTIVRPVLAKLDLTSATPSVEGSLEVLRRGGSQPRVDKNWMPWAAGGEEGYVYFTSSIEPHEVLRKKVDGGDIEVVATTSNPMLVHWRSKQVVLSGGSPIVGHPDDPEHLYGIGHFQTSYRVYENVFIKIRASYDFSVVSVSCTIPLVAQPREGKPMKGSSVAFVSGLDVNTDGNFIVSYGVADARGRMMTLSKSQVDSLFACSASNEQSA